MLLDLRFLWEAPPVVIAPPPTVNRGGAGIPISRLPLRRWKDPLVLAKCRGVSAQARVNAGKIYVTIAIARPVEIKNSLAQSIAFDATITALGVRADSAIGLSGETICRFDIPLSDAEIALLSAEWF